MLIPEQAKMGLPSFNMLFAGYRQVTKAMASLVPEQSVIRSLPSPLACDPELFVLCGALSATVNLWCVCLGYYLSTQLELNSYEDRNPGLCTQPNKTINKTST